MFTQEEVDTMIRAVDEPYMFPWEHEYPRNDCTATGEYGAVVKGNRININLVEDDEPMTIAESLIAHAEKQADLSDKLDEEYKKGYDEGYKKGYDEGQDFTISAYTYMEDKGKKLLEDINKAEYERGYKDGQNSLASAYAEGKGEILLEDVKKVEYERGLNDAWEAARKIVLVENDGGIPYQWIDEIFHVSDVKNILRDYSVSEVIEKLKAWDEKKAEDAAIQVGDEVLIEGARGVIVTSGNICKVILWENGQFSSWSSDFYDLSKRKTGRHFDQIADVLKQLRSES